MTKALALENIWALGFLKTKKQPIKAVKSTDNVLSLWLAYALIGINIIVLMSYIYGVNQLASVGYEIKTLQKQVAGLNEDNKKINLKVSEANSMVVIQKDFLNANFVAGGTTKFLQATRLTQR